MALRASLSWLIPYALSVLVTKGMSLLTIPLVTRYLSTHDYGQLELVSSLIEVAGIVLTFSVADVLFRLVPQNDEAGSKRAAAAIAGGAIVLAVTIGALLQGALWTTSLLPAGIDVRMVSVGLFTASLSALIELPLAWLRSRTQPRRFLVFTGSRSLLQAGLMALTLTQGYGALGILVGNCAVDCLLATGLLIRQARATGISLDLQIFARAVRYGAPLVCSALAMFVLGACDRWFLVASVTAGEIALYALAAKLAMIVALAVQPFGLWWYARRISVLRSESGLARSADAVAVGFLLLTCGGVLVAAASPILIRLALPAAYAPAATLIPALVAIVALNESCSLLNVGSYLGVRATGPLIVNSMGATTALVGYIFLAPVYGVNGAIIATLAGHSVRIIGFIIHGRLHAPIPYRVGLICAQISIACLSIIFLPNDAGVLSTILHTFVGLCLICLVTAATMLDVKNIWWKLRSNQRNKTCDIPS